MKVLSDLTPTTTQIEIDFCTKPNPDHFWMAHTFESVTIPMVGTFRGLQPFQHVRDAVYLCRFDSAEIKQHSTLTS